MQLLKTGSLYFALVFAVGFVLGTVRVLWAVPRFAERTAELMEIPIMLLVINMAARWFSLRGLSIVECAAARDPVSGTVYLMILLVFPTMPFVA